MGFSTIVAMMVQVGFPVLGQPILTAGWTLWWIDVTLSTACCITMPYLIVSSQKTRELRFLTTTWLLPVVPLIVSSATGAIIAGALIAPQHAMWTLMTCYALLGSGLSTALSILAVFSLRLMLHGFPVRENSASMFLPLGPFGQGAFAIQRLGSVARGLLPSPDLQNYAFAEAGDVLYVIGWVVSLPLLGLAILWLTMALIHLLTRRFPFNMVRNEQCETSGLIGIPGMVGLYLSSRHRSNGYNHSRKRDAVTVLDCTWDSEFRDSRSRMERLIFHPDTYNQRGSALDDVHDENNPQGVVWRIV